MHDLSLYPRIFDFIAGLGLPIAEGALPETTFLPGIAIRDGGLLVDPARLRWPGDLLHEAGHLAVLPPALRAQAHDDLPGHDDAHDDGAPHAGELEALAWAWAAAVHLGIPPDALIHEGGYRGRSRELLQMYALGIYPGLRGLCALGMTSAPGFDTPDVPTVAIETTGPATAGVHTRDTPPASPEAPAPPAAHTGAGGAQPVRYPQMHRWLRA